MTVYLSNRDGNGKTSEEGHYKFPVNAFSGNVLGANELAVTVQTPLAMGVTVAAGNFRIPTVDNSYAYTGWSNTPVNISIPTADPANPRISAIIIYVDKSAATAALPANNPGIAKIVAVQGTPAATPVRPSEAQIQSAIGAGNPYITLATVRVPAAASSVISTYITDTRAPVTLINDVLRTVYSAIYPIGSIYTNKVNSDNPALLFGFGQWVSLEGRVVVGRAASGTFAVAGSTGGAEKHTLSIAEMPSHGHNISTKNDDFNWNSSSAGVGPSFADARDGVTSYNSFGGIVLPNGGGQPHNNLQPYVVAYMWERVA